MYNIYHTGAMIMNILLTGDLTWVTRNFYNVIANKERKIVISGNGKNIRKKITEPIMYSYSPLDKEFNQLFRNYNFEVVIFISGSIDGRHQKHGENNELEMVLELCKDYHVNQVIYVTTTEIYVKDVLTANQILMYAAEELCRFYNDIGNSDVITIHSPYLFDMDNPHSFIGDLLNEAITNHKITIPYSRKKPCEFLAASDLAAFISRIIDDWDNHTYMYDLTSGETIIFENLGHKIIEQDSDIEVTYMDQITQVYPIPMPSSVPRGEYGWFAKTSILTELPALMEVQRQKDKEDHQKFLKKVLQRFSSKYERIRKFVELILLFIIVELINAKIGVYVQFQYVDLRLLYIVLIGCMNGTAMGVMAALLACLANFQGYRTLNISWEIIFYNIDNWLPFVFYILAGAITGYHTNKSREEVAFIKEQNKHLKEQYLFLDKLYENTLKSKELYKEQIVSSKESYGKLYGIIKKLDSDSPDVIYLEVLKALEDTLNLHSVAIYCVQPEDGSQQLKAFGDSIKGNILKHISASDCLFTEENWGDSELWVNSEQLDDYPMYCMKITSHEEIIAYIYIFDTDYTKMNVYNSNVIKIICGLAKRALHRAYLYGV